MLCFLYYHRKSCITRVISGKEVHWSVFLPSIIPTKAPFTHLWHLTSNWHLIFLIFDTFWRVISLLWTSVTLSDSFHELSCYLLPIWLLLDIWRPSSFLCTFSGKLTTFDSFVTILTLFSLTDRPKAIKDPFFLIWNEKKKSNQPRWGVESLM